MKQFIETYDWLLKLIPLVVLIIGLWKLFQSRRKVGWGKIKTKCTYTPNTVKKGNRVSQLGPASLLLEAVNHGPGEVTLSALKGRYKDKTKSNIVLQNTDRKLQQGDTCTRIIMPFDEPGGKYDGFFNEFGIELMDLWFEDTFGRKHSIKSAKNHLQKMRETL